MKKRNDKGFTLVELIVVLVILAILAAILVPALLGYIDKARQKQITTNAEAAYVAAQAVMTERYGKNTYSQLKTGGISKASGTDVVQNLAGIGASKYTYSATYVNSTAKASSVKDASAATKHNWFTIKTFTYEQDGMVARWYRNGSADAVPADAKTGAGEIASAGGWLVVDSSDKAKLPASK